LQEIDKNKNNNEDGEGEEEANYNEDGEGDNYNGGNNGGFNGLNEVTNNSFSRANGVYNMSMIEEEEDALLSNDGANMGANND
jgi:hypothetical protein